MQNFQKLSYGIVHIGEYVRQMLLIRHCQTSGQEVEAELTATGRKQAETLSNFLSAYPIDTIASSTYARARLSIAPFAARNGLPIHLDQRLIERRLSTHAIDNWREVLRDSFDDRSLRAPGGESGREAFDRGWTAITDLFNGDYRFPVAVTHGNLLSIILNSIDGNFGYDGWASLSNPDVFHLREAGRGRLEFERLWSE